MEYFDDHLGQGFEYTIIEQPNDYEGKVIATLVRKRCSILSDKAVLYIHGFNDYFFQAEMAQQFTNNGFHFYALDMRKYGRSILPHQKNNNMRSLTEYFADLDAALGIIRKEGNLKVLLSGHSTGGLLVTLYASQRMGCEKFDALYCNSPFYDLNMPNYQRRFLVPMVAFFGKIFPNIIVPGSISKGYGYSLHKEKFGEWDYNLAWKPHVAPPIHAGWIHAIYQGQSKIKAGIAISCPILIMHSHQSIFSNHKDADFFNGDAILNINDIKKGAERIKSPKRTIIEIKGGMHDLILSPKVVRDVVYELLIDWTVTLFK
ncbi:MAG: alpha/beta hydrolase [Flavobacterium sp.]